MPDKRPNYQLPARVDGGWVPAPMPEQLSPPGASRAGEPESEPAVVPLSHYLWVLKRHRWQILSFVATCVIATLIICSRITPIYESTVTVDIDRQTPTGVIGQEALRSPVNDADQFLATQVKLIQSDSVLRPVVQKYNLIDYREQARRWRGMKPASAEDAPVALKGLKVVRPANTYLVLISYRSPDPRLAADAANAIAQSYIEHTYNIRFRATAGLSAFMEKQLDELKSKMERSGAALAQFERELNVINPEEKTNILSARLLQLNAEYTKAQADRVAKEAAYNSIRTGTLEAAQVSSQGESLRRISERLDEVQQHFAQVKAEYGTKHPEYARALTQLSEVQRLFEKTRRSISDRVTVEYREAASRESMLLRAVAETKSEFDRLNAHSFQYQQLKREAEADKKLYEELVHKIKEAGINASFQNSSIRLADLARPPIEPVFPNTKLNVLLVSLCAGLLAMATAVVSDALDGTIRDPEQITRTLKTAVVGSLPEVKLWARRLPVASNGKGHAAVIRSERALEGKTDHFEEAIRTLRDSILLADLDHRVGSLMITSAAPREGKTLTSVHLALAHASQKRKTLLVDGDLRRPSVPACFGFHSDRGVSSILNGEIGWKQMLVQPELFPDLDILPAGPCSRRAADRLGAGLLPILEEASSQYDLIIVDSPPATGFAETLQVAALVDGVVIVARAGQTDYKAVASVVNTFHRLRVSILGVVLNGVHEGLSDRYYYYGYHDKYYHRYYGRDGKG